MLNDLEKQRQQLENLNKPQGNEEMISKVVELETMKKQAEDDLTRIARQARQCHEKLIRKVVNLEAMMKYSKEQQKKLTDNETENLKRTTILELEKLPKMKDEYEKTIADKEAEKSKLASEVALMREQVELKLVEIEKLKDLIKSEKTNSQMEVRDAKQKIVKEMANLQERNKILEDENAKFATKIISLKEALNTKRKEKKVIMIRLIFISHLNFEFCIVCIIIFSILIKIKLKLICIY